MFNLKKIVLIISIIMFVTLFVGCVQTPDNTNTQQINSGAPQTTPQQTTSDTGLRGSNAQYIGNFMAIASEQKIEARFSLRDGSKNYVSGDGTGQIKIVNSEGETVYSDTINVKKEDFGTYTIILTKEEFLAFVWEIPTSQIKKSTSSSGTMYLKFRLKTTEFEELDTPIWGLPTYSEQELAQLNEEQFTKSAVVVNNKLSKGSFEVIVTKMGFFTPLVTYGEKKEYFRIDMEVKNIGNEQEYFSPSGLAVLDNQGNQYEKEYGGTLATFSQIYPGVKKSGYIIFKNIPKTSQSVKLVFQLGHDASYKPYTFEYSIPLTSISTSTPTPTQTSVSTSAPIVSIVASNNPDTSGADMKIQHKGGDEVKSGEWKLSIVAVGESPLYKVSNSDYSAGEQIIATTTTCDSATITDQSVTGCSSALSLGAKYDVKLIHIPSNAMLLDQVVEVR